MNGHFSPSPTQSLLEASERIKTRFEERHGHVPEAKVPQDHSDPSASVLPNPDLLKILTSEIGIPQRQAIDALKATHNAGVEQALEHIWSQSQEATPMESEPTPISMEPQTSAYDYPKTIEEALKTGFIEGLGHVSTTPAAHQHETENETSAVISSEEKTLEQRQQEMLEKIRVIAEAKKAKEIEEQREAEKKRIHEGKNYAQVKREIKDQERRKEIEQAKKERQEQREYLKKMKEQVQREREMRSHQSIHVQQVPAPVVSIPAPVVAPAPLISDSCRVQIRHAKGAIQKEFSASASLSEVKRWITQELGTRNPVLMTTMPRKEVSPDGASLQELGFVPAVSLVLR
ncbi:hypothetical protein RCL1_003114 [Eukaryota sp. TZLM3-RCL]